MTINPKTIHTPIDAIEKAKEHARAAEAMVANLEAEGAFQDVTGMEVSLELALAQAWATIAIAQRSGR